MGGLWRWDIDAFRAIHLASRDLVSDPFLECINNMGLAHVQGLPLIIAATRRTMPTWALGVFIAFGLAATYLVENRGLPGAAAFALCLVLFWNLPKLTAWGALTACLVSGIFRVGVEAMVNRQRPSNFDFADPLEPVFSHSSFPSGHATTTMAIAVFLLWALRGSDRGLARIAFGWAILVGWGRIAAGVHYPMDVIGGFAVALAVATGTWLFFDFKGWREKTDELPETA